MLNFVPSEGNIESYCVKNAKFCLVNTTMYVLKKARRSSGDYRQTILQRIIGNNVL